MIERDYSSNYKIKEFIINNVAPKFFDLDEVNQYNVGLIGYVTEMESTTSEDTFNAMNIFMKETHPSRATMPDTIYTNASIYSVDNIMGRAGEVKGLLFIKEEDIIKKGTPAGDRYIFTFDSNAQIYVDGIYFSLDYDVIVTARPYRGDYQYLAQYDMTYTNSLSSIVHPYIKSHIIPIEGDNYIAFEVVLRQYVRTIIEENIIDNDKINMPIITLEYEDQLAGIDILYREPGSDKYILLEGRMEGMVPTEKPFYFYSIRDDGLIEISFTAREKYFQPKFNSDLKIMLYTTIGSKGNFKEYTGTNIQIINNNPKFEHMRQIIPFITVNGSCTGGGDALELEDIRTLTVENMATSGAYNTEEDINLFLRNYTELNDLFITFIKKRDDLIERLFTGFMLFKDKYGDYFHTNTLNLKLFKGLFDFESEALDRYIIKPGRIYRYDGDSTNTVVLDPVESRSSNVKLVKDEFIFTNPLLMVYQKKPNSIGYFINTVNDTLSLDFEHAEIDSPMQFIANYLKIDRNAVIGEDDYKFTVKIRPTRPIEKLPDGTLETDKTLRIVLSFEEGDGSETKAFELKFAEYDEETQIMTYKGSLKTDDIVSGNERLLVKKIYDLDSLTLGEHTIKMVDSIINVNILYDYGKKENAHPFNRISDLNNFTLVNRYSTTSDRANLVIPVNFIRSRAIYSPFVDGNDDDDEAIMSYYLNVYQVPLIAAHHVSDTALLMDFIKDVKLTYGHLRKIVTEKTSNYNIDIKFYNTYGRSINFVVGESEERLDKTNISIHIKVCPDVGIVPEVLFQEVREYTKNYIENVNKNKSQNIGVRGYNAIYISNLIQELENELDMLYMKFVKINDYDSSVQVIENRTVNTESMTLLERRDYIPEFLTIRLEDIKIDLITR